MKKQRIKKSAWIKLAGYLFLTVSLWGCTSHQARSVKPSGFLGDYSQLREGKGDQALLVYTNPEINTMCKNYTKIYLESVTLWAKDDSDLADVSKEEQQALTDYFYKSVATALKEDYTLVNTAGSDVMRIRLALTDAEGSWWIPDTITSLMPMAIGISALKRITLGAGSFVANVTVEAQIEDSITREPLVSIVDKRIGGKGWVKKFDSWGKVEASFDYWAEKMQSRLSECRAGKLEF